MSEAGIPWLTVTQGPLVTLFLNPRVGKLHSIPQEKITLPGWTQAGVRDRFPEVKGFCSQWNWAAERKPPMSMVPQGCHLTLWPKQDPGPWPSPPVAIGTGTVYCKDIIKFEWNNRREHVAGGGGGRGGGGLQSPGMTAPVWTEWARDHAFRGQDTHDDSTATSVLLLLWLNLLPLYPGLQTQPTLPLSG